jgi:lysophospholipase L1-like esterase
MSSKRLILAAVCALAGAAVAVASPAGAATESAPRAGSYVALGDSYSAGVGAGPYLDATCLRSNNSYAPLLAQALRTRAFSFQACSGATTADVLANQLAALRHSTTLVTISIGGNDIGFSAGIGACVQGTDEQCAGAVAAAEQVATTVLPARLDSVYAQIRAKAPHAKLLVLGYPHLVELTPDCAAVPSLTLARRTLLNEAGDVLAGVIAKQARKAGATFVDVRQVFAGHAVCSADPWINGLVADGAFHPNAAGYSLGYLSTVKPYAATRFCPYV